MMVKLDDLTEQGMLQYFYHSPSSHLPIRDVMNELKKGHKTEPHIEIGAENYLNCCYQPNIKSFLKSDANYLFLFTMCRNRSLKFYGTQYIIGFIEKTGWGEKQGHWFIKGPTKIYHFEDSFSMKDVFGKNLDRSGISKHKWVDENLTRKLLTHFDEKKNIIEECIKEITELDVDNKTCKRDICEHKNECKRAKLSEGT